jgi:hypothetical protein
MKCCKPVQIQNVEKWAGITDENQVKWVAIHCKYIKIKDLKQGERISMLNRNGARATDYTT